MIAILLMFHPVVDIETHPDDSLLVMFWNMENFFDWKDSGNGRSDAEFSSSGMRRWTYRRFCQKCNSASKALFWIGGRMGRMPDVIGLCEIENRGVLYRLLDDTLLRKYDYRIVHYDSGDRRGIDVALMYRDSSFMFVSTHRKVPEYEGKRMATRDILQVCLQRRTDGRLIHFIVNHHPSKFGGSKESDGRRMAAMEALKSVCDSLHGVSYGVPIVAMGDFNDIPSAMQFDVLDGVLENKSMPLFRQGRGTIRFQGRWDLIDMFLVSSDVSECSRMYIEQIPFLMVWDSSFPGFKPLRTYSGPRYTGGVSDHCPILLKINR